MQSLNDASILKIIINENDKYHHSPLYEKIIRDARDHNLAGATVYRGVMGYGKSSVIHTNKVLEISMDLPVIIEIIDKTSTIMNFIPVLQQLFLECNCGGIISIQNAEMIITP